MSVKGILASLCTMAMPPSCLAKAFELLVQAILRSADCQRCLDIEKL